MKKITNISSDLERAFYAHKNTEFENINIEGLADGESAFKECSDIKVSRSNFKLRYPFWHNKNVTISDSTFYNTCRAAFWYDINISFNNIYSTGVKVIRECSNVTIDQSVFDSDEPIWRSSDIKVNQSKISGNYAFFECKNVEIEQLSFSGKYSFQYNVNLKISNSVLKTKDAFWHTKDAVISDSVVEGEYLGWYSENITFIRCHIKGTQPLCYCKNLKLIDCTFEACDLAFEYSEVNGNIIGSIDSIKNPISGHIKIENISTLIQDENDRSNGKFILEVSNKNNY